jgi:hypothetical protein
VMNGEDLEVAAGGLVDDDVGKRTKLVAVRSAPRNRSSTRSSYQCCASTISLWPGGGAERFDSPDAARLSDLVPDVVPRVRHKFARVDLVGPLSGLVSPHASSSSRSLSNGRSSKLSSRSRTSSARSASGRASISERIAWTFEFTPPR